MTVDKDRVIRIPRSDDPSGFVLVYIVAPEEEQAWKLKLIATEGENPYANTIKKSHFKEFRSKTYQGSDEEFENVLASALKYRTDATSVETAGRELEVNASIRQGKDDGGNQLVIGIRKRIDTITQRIASITLHQDDNQTIELFEWTGLMTTRTDSLTQQISALTERLHAAEESIKTLNSSISELVASKKEHEDLLLANFVQVLNEKKLKIRNQQRLLAAAKVDEDKISELRQASSQHRHAEPKSSRKGKRKPTEEPSDSDEFERMDVDQGGPAEDATRPPNDDEEEDDDLEGRETPQPLEEETESEAEDEKEEKEPKSTRPNLAQPADPPPRRDLPFSKRTAAPSSTKVAEPAKAVDEEDGGETDDDEL